ncbi:MAG: Gfo/Idh/MocA family oxidoreductase [Syntrophobacterales bacterium]|jgi:predicted dehydrogenase|nr:Gfo/Idh/MocA family oxidoreductase [Syntrophobacterales bacterium]
MIKIGVIGYGYWGPNIVRNFNGIDGTRVVSVCDKNPDALTKVNKTYPTIKTISDPDEMLTSPEIDAVAVITPVFMHFDFAKKALQNGKHVFVEKPFTSTAAQARELIDIAEKRNLKIMVDHTFLFTGAVKKIKQFIDEQALGNVHYFDSMRVNLGLFQHDVNVVWDLAPHDFSVMDYLMEEKPVALAATGQTHYGEFEDVAYVTVYFENNLIAHFNVNWLSPVKIRMTLIGGDKKMLVWNDLENDEKIKIYDKGVDVKMRESVYDLLVSYRSGDVWAPKVPQTEALKLEAEYFVDCIENNKTPINDGLAGLRVVNMLEAANMSIKEKGKLINL